MSALECTNPFAVPNHSENNNYPLKRVSLLIQSHASHIGYSLEIGQKICDKCRLFARNKFVQSRKQKIKARTPKQLREFALKSLKSKAPNPPKVSPKKSYMMPTSDSSHQIDSNEPYSLRARIAIKCLAIMSDRVGDGKSCPQHSKSNWADSSKMPS